MENINQYIGSKIRSYRKTQGLTLQQLADMICKSRASVSKYETGEITVDIQTLYDISKALHIPLTHLTDHQPESDTIPGNPRDNQEKNPFFRAEQLFLYFYDGRVGRLKDGIINIYKTSSRTGEHKASLSISTVTPYGRSSETYFSGNVLYSDMLIRFSFVNQINTLEEDLLYIFNPLEARDFSDGLLCGISSIDFRPCAFKCLVALKPQKADETLKKQLLLTPQDLKRWKKLNMLIVDNR